jgi:hypothetical protein
MISASAYDFGTKIGKEIKQRLETQVGISDLSDDHSFELARARLRLAGFDTRAELIRALHVLCRNLSTSCFAIGVVA